MKWFLLLLAGTFTPPAPGLLILDLTGKNPLHAATDFPATDCALGRFPLYAADLAALIAATEKAARAIGRPSNEDRVDTLAANHTLVLVRQSGGNNRTVTVRLVTRLAEGNARYDAELLHNEQDLRKAQRTVLAFADYLGK